MARRKEDTWYLGAVTNESSREVSIPLDFLDKGHRYKARILQDGDDANTHPEHVRINTITVSSTDTIEVKLADSGGEAIIFNPSQ